MGNLNTKSQKSAKSGALLPILDGKARLSALRQIRGIWKRRKPDPIKEQEKLRREWDRKLA